MRLDVTRRTDLAARALITLARHDRRMKAPELAELLDSTAGFLPQVLGPLVAQGWVRSDPGPTGGYQLRVPLAEISVLDVVEAIEGPTDSGRCVLAGGPCQQSDHCALHVPWQRARQLLLAELGATPLSEVPIPARQR